MPHPPLLGPGGLCDWVTIEKAYEGSQIGGKEVPQGIIPEIPRVPTFIE